MSEGTCEQREVFMLNSNLGCLFVGYGSQIRGSASAELPRSFRKFSTAIPESQTVLKLAVF